MSEVYGIELFAGMGVALTGLKEHINMFEAYEISNDPAKSIELNHKDILVRKRNIFDISFHKNDADTLIFPYDKSLLNIYDDQIKENNLPSFFFDNIISNDCDIPLLVSGGPPCQPYSALNQKKDPNDPRIKAIDEFLRIVDELKPRYVMFENIPRIFKYLKSKIITSLKNMGYNLNVNIMSSEKYGDPQIRKRWIVLASKAGYINPIETHGGNLAPLTTAKTFLGKPGDETEIGITEDKLLEINRLLKKNNYEISNWTRMEGRKWDTVHIVDANKPIKAVTNATKLYYMYYDPKQKKVVRKLNFTELKGAFGLDQSYEIFGNNSSIAQQLANSNTIGVCSAIGKAIIKNYDKYN